MRMILGLDRPNAGTAHVDGRPYVALPGPLREVGALLDAKDVHGGRTRPQPPARPGPQQRDPPRAGSRRCWS